jgi:hypothetical protein
MVGEVLPYLGVDVGFFQFVDAGGWVMYSKGKYVENGEIIVGKEPKPDINYILRARAKITWTISSAW